MTEVENKANICKLINEELLHPILSGKNLITSTKGLHHISIKTESILKQILKLSQKPIQELIEKIQQNLGVFFSLSEIVARFDMILAFANYSLSHPYKCVRPKFVNTFRCVYLIKSRNPILEKVLKNEGIVSHDYKISSLNCIQLINGAQSSGESVYLKQLALTCIMAQMGCYVPCTMAYLSPYEKIFTKFGSNDLLEQNQSSLSIELTQMDNILSNIKLSHSEYESKCLILIDGFGKSTSAKESNAFSIAYLEEMLKCVSTVLFTTQENEVLELKEIYLAIQCLKMQDKTTDKVNTKHTYKIEEMKSPSTNEENHKCVSKETSDIFLKKLEENKKVMDKWKPALSDLNSHELKLFNQARELVFEFLEALASDALKKKEKKGSIKKLPNLHV